MSTPERRDRRMSDRKSYVPEQERTPERVEPAWIHEQGERGWPDMHPEDYCHRCGNRNMTWYTDQDTWRTATEEWANLTGMEGICCPTCLAEMYEATTGKRVIWRFVPYDGEVEVVQLREELAATRRDLDYAARTVNAVSELADRDDWQQDGPNTATLHHMHHHLLVALGRAEQVCCGATSVTPRPRWTGTMEPDDGQWRRLGSLGGCCCGVEGCDGTGLWPTA